MLQRSENMVIFVLLSAFVIGYFLSIVISKISLIISNTEDSANNINKQLVDKLKARTIFTSRTIILILISGVLFLISFFKIGLNVVLIQALALNCILIVVSFVDIEHQIIPNKLIMTALVIGIVCLFINDISLINALGGMSLGGGLLLLLALVPGVLGGGDIKLMFVLGIFLGLEGVLVAIFLAFAIAAIISILLLLLKIKERKDHIPFGPFLSIGTFIAFHFLNRF